MHAAMITLTIDPAQAAAAAAAFSKTVLPQVTSAEGFVRGFWVDPVDGQGFGFVLFDTADQARRAMTPTADWSAPGVTIQRLDVRRVAVAIP